MNEFSINYLRSEGNDLPVLGTDRGLLYFEIPRNQGKISNWMKHTSRLLAGPRLSSLHPQVPGTLENADRINVYEYLDSSLASIISKAYDASIRHSHRAITSAHLLSAMLEDPFVMRTLTRRLQASVEQLSSLIARELTSDAGEPIARVILRAAGIASMQGTRSVSTVDLLIAMVQGDKVIGDLFALLQLHEDDRINVVQWLWSSDIMVRPTLKQRFASVSRNLMWGYPVSGREAYMIVGRDAAVQETLRRMKAGESSFIFHADTGAGIDGAACALAGALEKEYPNRPVLEVEMSQLCKGVSSSLAQDRLRDFLSQAKSMKSSAVIVRGFGEYVGMAGAHGFDLSSALFDLMKKSAVPMIIVLDRPSLEELRRHGEYPNPAVIQIPALSESLRIQMILAHLCDIEDRYHIELSYQAIKTWISAQTETSPSAILAKLDSLLSKIPSGNHRLHISDDVMRRLMNPKL